MIGDARTITRLSLADWLKHDKIVKLLRQRGFRPPLLGIMAEPGHEPAVAIVNHGSWKAICPDPGCPGAEVRPGNRRSRGNGRDRRGGIRRLRSECRVRDRA